MAVQINSPYKSFQCLRTLKLPSAIPLSVKSIKSLVIDADAQTVLTDTNNFEWGVVKRWDVYTGQVVQILSTQHSVCQIAISTDGQTLVSGGNYLLSGDMMGEVVKVWDVETGREIHKLEATPEEDGTSSYLSQLWSVAISSDRQVVVSGQTISIKGKDKRTKYQGGQLRVWSLQTGQEICTLNTGSILPLRVAIASLPPILAISGGRRIRIWNWETQKEICTLPDGGRFGLKGYFAEPACSLAISPDGQTIVSGDYKNTIILWDLQTKEKICTLSGHTSAVRSVNISPDGQTITSCSADGTVKVWGLR